MAERWHPERRPFQSNGAAWVQCTRSRAPCCAGWCGTCRGSSRRRWSTRRFQGVRASARQCASRRPWPPGRAGSRRRRTQNRSSSCSSAAQACERRQRRATDRTGRPGSHLVAARAGLQRLSDAAAAGVCAVPRAHATGVVSNKHAPLHGVLAPMHDQRVTTRCPLTRARPTHRPGERSACWSAVRAEPPLSWPRRRCACALAASSSVSKRLLRMGQAGIRCVHSATSRPLREFGSIWSVRTSLIVCMKSPRPPISLLRLRLRFGRGRSLLRV